MNIPDLSKFSDEDLQKFVDSFDTVLTDLDGVLWVLGSPLDGAKEAVAALEALGKRFFYVTNNATCSVEQYVTNLTRLGYSLTEEQIVTPAITVAHYLQKQNFRGKAHVLGSLPFRQTLIAAGIQCLEETSGSQVLSLEDTKNHLRHLDPETAAVILDYAPRIGYLQMLEANTLLKRPQCAFIVGATDYDVPVAHDVCLLGPGYFSDLLRASSGREPTVAGKPSPVVADVVASRYPQLNPKRTLFIGDSMAQDVQQGHLGGFLTLLVLSGVSSMSDVEKTLPTARPHFVAPSLGALVSALRRLGDSQGRTTLRK